MKKYDAIVVGAGNAGIGAAAALASQGHSVLVVEKQALAGGYAASFIRGRFEFDASIHALLFDFPPLADPTFRECWERLGIREPMIEITGGSLNVSLDENGTRREIEIPDGLDGFYAMAEKEVPGSREQLDRFIRIGKQILYGSVEFGNIMFGKGDPAELEKKRAAFAENYPDYNEYASLSVEEAFDRMKISRELRQLIGLWWFYAGTRFEDLPFMLYFGIFYGCVAYKASFPAHTAHGYLAELEKLILDHGGEIFYNTEVTEIIVRHGRVCGVKTDRGETFETGHVICNASPGLAYGKLIRRSEVRPSALKLVHSLKDNFSFFIIWLGLNATAEQIGIRHHHQFINTTNDYHATHEAGYSLEGPFCLGGLCPNITIPDFSPEGTCVLSISVPIQPCAFEGLNQEEYVRLKNDLAGRIIDEYERISGLDLRSYIEEIEIATPATLARYGNTSGGALGYQITPANHPIAAQVSGLFENYIKGLDFVGQFSGFLGYANNPLGIAAGDRIGKSIREGR